MRTLQEMGMELRAVAGEFTEIQDQIELAIGLCTQPQTKAEIWYQTLLQLKSSLEQQMSMLFGVSVMPLRPGMINMKGMCMLQALNTAIAIVNAGAAAKTCRGTQVLVWWLALIGILLAIGFGVSIFRPALEMNSLITGCFVIAWLFLLVFSVRNRILAKQTLTHTFAVAEESLRVLRHQKAILDHFIDAPARRTTPP